MTPSRACLALHLLCIASGVALLWFNGALWLGSLRHLDLVAKVGALGTLVVLLVGYVRAWGVR